jgi:hypothetical protein
VQNNADSDKEEEEDVVSLNPQDIYNNVNDNGNGEGDGIARYDFQGISLV